MNIQLANRNPMLDGFSVNQSYRYFICFLGVIFLLATNVVFISEANAAECGALNQKPCKITFKRLKACDKGLHTNLKTKRCVLNKGILPPKQKNCGKLGQYACKVTVTRPKACDFGLVRDKNTKRCRKVKSVIPPKQLNCGKLGQYACKVTVTRPKACDFGLVRDKNTKRCRKIKSVIPPKQLNCGKLGQYACKVTVTRPKACDFGLVRDKNTKRCRKIKSPIPPKQLNCGKLGQYACKVTVTRPKACDFGLHRDKNTRRCVKNQNQFEKQYNCGKLNQVACKITIRRPKMCDFGLHKDRKTGRCVRNKVNPLTIISTAKNIANESVSLIKIMGTGAQCVLLKPLTKTADFISGKQREPRIIKAFKQLIEEKDVNAALRIGSSPCIKKVVSAAAREGYKTVTVGVSSGGAFIGGAFLDTGFAYDIKALNRYYKKQTNTLPVPTLYQAKGGSVGAQAGGGNALSLGLYKSTNLANPRGSKTHGATLTGALVAGVGTGVWFNDDGSLDGISATLTTGGAEVEAAYNRLTTSIYNLDKPTQISDCGSRDKPACKKWERIKACDDGLRHNLKTGRCIPKYKVRPLPGPKPIINKLNCGAAGQRVCLVQERVPGCNPGLKIDFKLKRCVYK